MLAGSGPTARGDFREQLKLALLSISRSCGAFRVASHITDDRLRILCYHGTSFEREHELNPTCFIQPENFRRRMQFLQDWGATILPLDDALLMLRKNDLPDKAVTITIDDGWFGTYAHMLPILKEFGFPATVYLSTHHIEKQTFLFSLFIKYILMQTTSGMLDLGLMDTGLKGKFRPDHLDHKQEAFSRIVKHGETVLDPAGREALCFKLANLCNYDIDQAVERRMFKFMNLEEAAELPAMGFDVQLHTHRHVLSRDNRAEAEKEVRDNMRVLAGLGIQPCKHFCYPSGEYVTQHADWLSAMGIESAVTADFGLAAADSHVFFLKRICDSDAMGDLDFEAAISGFKELVLRKR